MSIMRQNTCLKDLNSDRQKKLFKNYRYAYQKLNIKENIYIQSTTNLNPCDPLFMGNE